MLGWRPWITCFRKVTGYQGDSKHFHVLILLLVLMFLFLFVLCNEMKVKVSQSYPTLCYPMDYTDHGILQASILEWVAFPFSRGSSWPSNWTLGSPALQADSLPLKYQGSSHGNEMTVTKFSVCKELCVCGLCRDGCGAMMRDQRQEDKI